MSKQESNYKSTKVKFSARKEFRVGGVFWILIAVPIATIILLLLIFANRKLQDLPVVVVDRDQSVLSRQLIRSLDETQIMDVVQVSIDAAEATSMLKSGKVYGIIYLNKNLEKKATRGESPAISASLNAQWLLVYNLLNKSIREVVTSYANSDFDCNAQDPIIINNSPLHNPQLDYLAFLVLAMAPAIWQLALMLSVARVFPSSLSRNSSKIVSKKLLTLYLGVIIAGSFTQIALLEIIGIQYNIQQLLFWLLAFVISNIAILSFIFGVSLWFKDGLVTSSIAAVIGAPAFAFCGVTYPRISMPIFAKFWAGLMPSTHMVDLQTRILIENATLSYALSPLKPLIILSLIFILFAFSGYMARYYIPFKISSKKNLGIENKGGL